VNCIAFFEDTDILNHVDKFDHYYKKYLQFISQYYGKLMQYEIDWFENQLAFQRDDLAQRTKDLAERNKDIAKLKATLSWKITAPLRNFGNIIDYASRNKIP